MLERVRLSLKVQKYCMRGAEDISHSVWAMIM